jgi:predicted dehydrogenase
MLPIIQVGAGHWGASWAHVVHRHADVEMVAVVDRDEAAAVRAAAEIGLPPDRCFVTLDDALARAPEAAVLVVTPPEQHESVTLTALAAGRHCLVEKPIANNVAAAQRMIDAAAASGRTVMISQNYRFRRGPRTVQRLIAAHAVGAVEQVRIEFARDHEFDGFMVEIPEPLVARWLIHQFDLQRAVLGADFTELRARSWNPSWSRFAGNAACLVELRSPSGLEVIYTGSWVARGPATTDDGNWRIEGREGAIVWCGDEIVVYPTT